MLRMSVPGERVAAEQGGPPVAGSGAELLAELGIRVSIDDAVAVAVSRAAAEPVELRPVEADDVGEVIPEGGVGFFPPAERGALLMVAPGAGAATVSGSVPLATTLATGDARRGTGDWAIEGLRLIDVDLAGRTAAAVAAGIDRRLVAAPGLYRWDGAGLRPVEATLPADGAPWLLFLHGTFSNTMGSFAGLVAQKALWRRLEDQYPGRVLALEHHTLTTSPVDNALEVLAHLPGQAKLHLVGYSRGGLVGELLCRGHLVGRALPFDADELALFDAETRPRQRAALERLDRMLAKLRPSVERFVRVGCPARGTTLVSGRLDRWLNFVLNAVGIGVGALTSPIAGEVYDLVKAFLLAVIKERTDPDTVPGLEAMIPGSPLIRLLNRPGVVSASDLAVIKGDIEGAGILGRLKLLGTDLFFREDHDLVVNTSAMNGGMAREPAARELFDQGPEVSHFAYFANPRTAGSVVAGLLRADDADAGFAPIPAETVATVAMPATRAATKRPLVFVLPGITGTVLHAKGRRIWVDLPQLAVGGLRRLAIDAPDVIAGEPVARYYGDLCDYLGRSHEVRPWGYDWRRSILDNATAFGTVLGRALADTTEPVRVVAHSMGGLVARAAFLDARLWQRFRERDGARLIQLGTPNGGSWGIPYMLMGRDRFMGYLALLDLTMSRQEQQRVVARFPGALEMLPHAETALYDPARWTALAKLDPGDLDWMAPRAEDLAGAARFRDQLARAPSDPERLLYVAGQAETLIGIEEDAQARPGQRIRFRTTEEGDGQVPWATGIPPGIRAWYTDAVHGDLARHRPAFPAILDLLDTGTTVRLPTAPPPPPRRRGPPVERVRDEVPMFPDAEDLLAAGIGGSRRAERAAGPRPVRIRVVHGHLAFARYPVTVGHYAGDTINGAERQLDQALDGRLTERKRLGLYPGALGTNTVALDRTKRPRGAIVVGLGDHADLGPGTLAETLRLGLLAYAVECDDHRRALGAAKCEPLEVTALLVGSGLGGMPIPACVEALLRAVLEAQRLLGDDGLREVELLELVESRAIRAWHELDRALQGSEFRDRFTLEPEIGRARGGRRNVAGEDDRPWGQPIQIPMEDAGGEGVMRYVPTFGRARAEAALVPGNTGFVERFVAQATGAAGSRAADAGRALFELLWPARIKETSNEDRNLRLVLDDRAAGFPWELLDDRRPWLIPERTAAGDAPKPAAVRAGLVRQLVQTQFRERIVAPAGRRRALVVGDPRAESEPGFAPLPGAEEEAHVVAERLRRAGYEVTHLAGAKITPQQVVAALFEHAWTIVHIAAHGAVDYPRVAPDGTIRTETGIVLGGGLFLGPAILHQLPVVPEIAFVNCCHLGTVDAAAEAARVAQRANRPGLAASVAVELVRMGVRGVIAAGWAVDDIKAARFAERFYDGMLDGLAFGRAVLAARQSIYSDGRDDTTWGAYQCYGEPDWRLVAEAGDDGDGQERPLASLAEALALAEEIREAAQVGLDRDYRRLRARLDRLNHARRRNAFLDQPELQAALAEAYGELGSLPKAVRYYDTAIRAGRGAVALKAIEQRANLAVRLAVRSLPTKPGKKRLAAARAEIEAAVATLDRLIELAGATIERHNLKGSAYKRLASILRARERLDALDRMRGCYAQGRALAEELGDPGVYSELMMLTADVLRHHLDGTEGREQTSARLRAITDKRQLKAAPDNFWDAVAVGDARVLAALADGVISPEEETAIIQAYLEPWHREGSRLKLGSVTEQLEFLELMLAEGPETSRAEREALIPALRRIRRKIATAG